MAGHRYWRLALDTLNGGSEYGAAEIKMTDVAGGPNRCVGGVPSASTIYPGYPATAAFDGDAGTGWYSANTNPPQWIQYDFGAGNSYAIIQFSWTSTGGYPQDCPNNGRLQFSDDGVAFTDLYQFTLGAFTGGQTKTSTYTPSGSPEVDASEVRAFSIFSGATSGVMSSAARVFAVWTVPTSQISSSASTVIGIVTPQGPIDISDERVFAVVKGRVADPKVRAWTFTLDGHDFYVLRLGDRATLVYDVTTEQWTEWNSEGTVSWRPRIGTTWIGAQKLGPRYGSNVVAGDDTFGLLWFLDPNQPYDDAPDRSRARQQIPFDRVVTGQVLASGREYVACYAIFLEGDNYGINVAQFTPAITLETSDDQGRTFEAHDTLDVVLDPAQDRPYEWTSLGQISAPGRIFRVTDNGIYARIDSMDMNDGG